MRAGSDREAESAQSAPIARDATDSREVLVRLVHRPLCLGTRGGRRICEFDTAQIVAGLRQSGIVDWNAKCFRPRG